MAALALAAACAGQGARGRGAGAPGDEGGGAPLEVARAFYRALHAGDAKRAADLVGSPHARSATESFVKLASAYRQLEVVVRERFGAEAARAVGYSDRMDAEDEALRRAREEVRGDEAVVAAGGETLATLRRVNGAWRILLEDALATEAGVAGLALQAEASVQAVERVSPAIRQGLFDGPEDALEAFRSEVAMHAQRTQPDLPREAPPRPRGDLEL